jgi:hypothetical protein
MTARQLGQKTFIHLAWTHMEAFNPSAPIASRRWASLKRMRISPGPNTPTRAIPKAS